MYEEQLTLDRNYMGQTDNYSTLLAEVDDSLATKNHLKKEGI